MANPVEVWKQAQHPLDVWPEIERHARQRTAMEQMDAADLERMKWYGLFYRKRDGDGRYMNRIRIPAGELTAAQAKEIAYIAYELGHGIIDITTRCNLQVQGLGIQHLPDVLRRLERVGLTSRQTGHDNVRNVFGHPLSGLLPHELIDTRRLCYEITEIVLGDRTYADLPRKVNICVHGMPEHPTHLWTQDISFLAIRDAADDVRFQLLIGGTQGQNPHLAWHVPVLIEPEQVVATACSLLDLFRTQGSREKRNACRLRYLIEQKGIGGVLDWFDQTLPFRLQPYAREPVPAAYPDELVGWIPQRHSQLWTMGLCVPLGRLSWQQLEGVAVLSKRWGNGQLRATYDQSLAVINLPRGMRDAAATDAARWGLSIHADPLDRNTLACTGSQFCNIAVTETKGHMFQLIDKLRRRSLKLHGIRIHMSGCPSSCAQHFTADIGLKGVRVRRLLGTREGFDVFLGGGIAGAVEMARPYRLGVDVTQLPALIEEVVEDYYRHHRAGQTFSTYWRDKLGSAEAAKVADADYQRPMWVCDACDHRHAGDDPPVFCPQCYGLRRRFARLESDAAPGAASVSTDANVPMAAQCLDSTDGRTPVSTSTGLSDV